jgi:hypothetical protein
METNFRHWLNLAQKLKAHRLVFLLKPYPNSFTEPCFFLDFGGSASACLYGFPSWAYLRHM